MMSSQVHHLNTQLDFLMMSTIFTSTDKLFLSSHSRLTFDRYSFKFVNETCNHGVFFITIFFSKWHDCYKAVCCVSVCVQSSESHRQTDSPSFIQQTSNSPFRGSYSPSSGQSFYPRLSSSHPGLSQDHPPSSYPIHTPTSSSDSRSPAGSVHQQSGSSNVDGGHSYGSSHLKASLLNSSGLAGTPTPGPRAHGQTKTDSNAQASRGSQQQASRNLKSASPGQAALQAGSRLLSASGPTHYPQRGTSLSQFQHSPLQGSGVRTQSGSF